MKLNARSIFFTVVAAVFAVMFVNMFMSLGPDARAMLLTVIVVLILTAPGIAMLAYHAGKGRDRRTDDEPTEHARDVEAYFTVDRAVSRLACARQAAYEQGRDDARADAARQIATDNAIAWLTANE